MDKTKESASRFNALIKENEDVYKTIAKRIGLSECGMWIMYLIREQGKEITQSYICSMIYTSKQTVNSSIKQLIKDGYLETRIGSDKRSRLIKLTAKGEDLARETADKILDAEYDTMNALSEAEQEQFLSLFRKYTDALKERMSELGKEKEEK